MVAPSLTAAARGLGCVRCPRATADSLLNIKQHPVSLCLNGKSSSFLDAPTSLEALSFCTVGSIHHGYGVLPLGRPVVFPVSLPQQLDFRVLALQYPWRLFHSFRPQMDHLGRRAHFPRLCRLPAISPLQGSPPKRSPAGPGPWQHHPVHRTR